MESPPDPRWVQWLEAHYDPFVWAFLGIIVASLMLASYAIGYQAGRRSR